MDKKEKAIEALTKGVMDSVEQANKDGMGIPEIGCQLSYLAAHMCLFSTDGHALGVGPALDGVIGAIKANLEEAKSQKDEEEEKCDGSKES
tara:strand:+ start:269 stop:541 length:273 start_codon:yes stop_codon:yes gene_type:complete